MWQAFSVSAGNAQHLDGALANAVAPAVKTLALDRFSFVRWVDGRGPHLRLAFGRDGWDDGGVEEVAERLREGLGRADEAPVREPVLPLPASQRKQAPYAVEPMALDGDDVPEHRLHDVSSATVLAALPELPRGGERFAYGLSLMTALSEAALERPDRPAFWDDLTRRWTGDDERGRRLLERLAQQADRLGPGLVEQARALRDTGAPGAALRVYARECGELLAGASRDDLARHAHLTANRLGVTPLEEALLASVLAAGVRVDGSGGPATDAPAEPADTASAPAGEGEAAVRLVSVTKDGDEAPVLDDITLEVARGETFGLLGPDGAGKSSLLGIAAGLRVAASGDVRVLGRDPRRERQALRGDVAMPVPDGELAEESTVRENLELRARAQGAGTVDAVLEATALQELAATPARELEPGALRRLALGTALLDEPAVLLLDEPTAGLSAVEREEVWAIVAARRDAGATTIIATSSLQEVRSTCDRCALVIGGQIVAAGPPEELAAEQFPSRSVHFRVTDEPDRALLEDLPEAGAVRIDDRPDHWAIEIETLQPDELLKLLGADPDFPRIGGVSGEDLERTFLRPKEGA